ncbi:four helix bundle protein [Candidatus Kaiserbacteria bacterium]|nr:four helix bundle protein [Candidatus Kaiserbacteria bacterium]
MERIKSAYILWHEFHATIPKIQRYSLGSRIDALFIEMIEATAQAAFIPRSEKEPWVRLAIRKLDALKILLMVLWETKSLDTKKYAVLSEHLDEIGTLNIEMQKSAHAEHTAKITGGI